MEHSRRRIRRKGAAGTRVPPISEVELAQLGDGRIAYIRSMTTDEAQAMFPAIEGLRRHGLLFALHAADGTPIALTDSRQAAIGHAMDDELEIASVH